MARKLNKKHMKFYCEQKDFLHALNIVGKAISPNNTLPVLNNILIKAEGKNLYFTATNLEIAIKYVIPADIRNEGSLTVPAKLLTSYVSLLPNDKIEATLTEGLTFSLKSTSSQTKIKGISADEFPLIPQIEKDSSFSISTTDFDKAVTQVVIAASLNTSRPVLTGVYFNIEKNILKLAATDSYRLTEKKISVKGKDLSLEFLVPSRTLQELIKITNKNEEKNVEISVSKNQVLFQVGNVELTSRLIEGKFPDYERIIPKASKTKIEVSTEDLSLIMKRVGLFAREDNNSVKISLTNDGKMSISTDETRVGEEKAEVNIKIEGENNKISLNAQYLLDVLTCIGEDKIIFEMNDKLSPALIKSCKEDGYVYIIMPLKV